MGWCQVDRSDLFRFFDDDIFHRNVGVHTGATGFHAFDLVDDILAFGDFTENAVTPTVLSRIVEEIVVVDVDEELGRCGMRIGRSRHRDTVFFIGQTVVRFIFNRCVRFFLVHAGLKPAALNHETVDNAMENGIVVMSRTNLGQKVFNGFGSVFGIEFDLDRAEIGMQCDGHNNPYDEIKICQMQSRVKNQLVF